MPQKTVSGLKRLRNRVIIGAAVLALVMVAERGIELWIERDRSLDEEKTRVSTLAEFLEDHARRSIQSFILAFANIDMQIRPRRGVDESKIDWDGLLTDAISTMPEFSAISYLDAAGVIRQSTSPQNILLDVSDKAFWKELQEKPKAEIIVGQPYLGIHSQYIIPVARPIRDSFGKLSGAIVGYFNPSRLSSFYSALAIGQEATVGLISAEGVILVREPHTKDMLGESVLSDYPDFPSAILKEPTGTYIGSDLIHTRSLISYRFISDLDLVVTVALPFERALEHWYRDLRTTILLLGVSYMILGALMIVLVRNLNARMRVEEKIVAQKRELTRTQQAAKLGSFRWTPEKDIVWITDELVTIIGPLEYTGRYPTLVDLAQKFDMDHRYKLIDCIQDCAENKSEHMMEVDFHGSKVQNLAIHAYLDESLSEGKREVYAVVQDVTVWRNIEAQLRHAQKMEATGQLTGGVAHDFNNLLTVVLGNMEMLLDDLDPADDRRDLVETTFQAAMHGSKLAQRLLAFSRRQTLSPVVFNVATLVADMESLLSKVLGEQVDLRLKSDHMLWNVEADRALLETSLINLAANSRDAMHSVPGGGALTIETRNTILDANYCSLLHDVEPGSYVRISVSDNGTGMPPEVMERAFDPFFTTKSREEGSGLGLSMVYGFVKQSGGHIRIYSEIGVGTCVTIYLPRANKEALSKIKPELVENLPRGTEKVLLVEDDELVRGHIERALRSLGYLVTSRPDGPSAIDLVTQGAEFDLLLTDVVLPGGLNGRQVADKIAEMLPGLPVMFASGYSEDAISHRGLLDEGVILLQKPFLKADLAGKVRQALSAGRSAAAV